MRLRWSPKFQVARSHGDHLVSRIRKRESSPAARALTPRRTIIQGIRSHNPRHAFIRGLMDQRRRGRPRDELMVWGLGTRGLSPISGSPRDRTNSAGVASSHVQQARVRDGLTSPPDIAKCTCLRTRGFPELRRRRITRGGGTHQHYCMELSGCYIDREE